MAEWAVELKGDKFDLEELPKEFHSPDLLVVREGDRYLLRSDQFACYSSESDIYSRAVILLERINGTMKIRMSNFINVGIEALISIDDQGVPHRHYRLHLEGGHIRIKGGAITLLVSPQGETVGTPESSSMIPMPWAMIADKDTSVSKVLRLFAQDLSWANLYKISEVVHEDQGDKIVDKGWARLEDIKDFKATANSYRAIGEEARHTREKEPAPQNPMTLNEAQVLIRAVVEKWLQEKASILKAP